MNKGELVVAISEGTGIKKSDVEAVVKAFTNTVVSEVKRGEKVQLIGFGTWEPVERAARVGINPQTKEQISIPKSVSMKFKVGKAVKDQLN